MNDIIDNLMTFINENTTILIIICVFLIVLLVIYLIDNAIKSSSITKNKEKAREEADKKAKENITKVEENNVFEDAVVSDSPKVEEIFNETPVDKIDEEVFDINEIINSSDEETVENDVKSVDVIYKNDKKLADILFGNIENQPKGKLNDNIVKKDDNIQKLEDTSDELDRIMEKLNNYNNQVNIDYDDDNFTNMF